MRRYVHGILGAFAVLASGCSTQEAEHRIYESWKGEHVEQVFRHWGLPERKVNLRDGSTLYEWDHVEQFVLAGSTTGNVSVYGNTAYINTVTSPPATITAGCTRTFVTNRQGNITEGYSRGDNCCVMTVAGYCSTLANPARPELSK